MPTDKNTIYSYDKYAIKWASRLREGLNSAHKFLEKPAMYGKLPNLKGKTVLCLGCGTGEECDYLSKQGAEKVVGIDISKGLIDFAKQSYPDVEFRVMDIEKLEFTKNSFDYAYSSLTMHYLESWGKALREVKKVLKPGGTFLFSTHHPVRWGAEKISKPGITTYLLGYEKNKVKKTHQVYGDYLAERKIKDLWFSDFAVTYYHRPLSAVIADIIKSGFGITDFIEPKPIETAKEKEKAFYEIHNRVPLFMIFELRKTHNA